jgi:hypothetical protein
MKFFSLLGVVLLASAAVAAPVSSAGPPGVYGVDVSEPTSAAQFACLRENGFSFAIVRCFRSVGSPDPACAASVASAWEAGLSHVDLYFFPDAPRGNATAQAEELLHYIAANNIRFGMVWLDVEQYRWGPDTTANLAFIKELVTTLGDALGGTSRLGMYTSHRSWTPITGGSLETFGLPLWWPRYSRPTPQPGWASTWVPFGGWEQPAIHQYNDAMWPANNCTGSYDVNFYPN